MKLKTLFLGAVVLSLATSVAYKTGHLKHPQFEPIAVQAAKASRMLKDATGFDANRTLSHAVRDTTRWLKQQQAQQSAQQVAPANAQASAAGTCGVADRITDGRSFTLRAPGHPALRVQLAEIEVPASFHEYSDISAKALASLIQQREVCLGDAEGNPLTVAEEHVIAWAWRKGDRTSINHQMVAGGHAYATTFELTERSLLEHQTFAQRERRGMWAVPAIADPRTAGTAPGS